MQVRRWLALGIGAAMLIAAVTTWLLASETRGAEIANILALPVAIIGTITAIIGIGIAIKAGSSFTDGPPSADSPNSQQEAASTASQTSLDPSPSAETPNSKDLPTAEAKSVGDQATPNLPSCTFCSKGQSEVKLITNKTDFLCNECNDLGSEIFEEQRIPARALATGRICALTLLLADPDLSMPRRQQLLLDLDYEAANVRPSRRPTVGDKVANARLVRIIGTGNFGTVWQAVGPEMTDLAVKVFDPDKISIGLMLWRFQRGIRAMQYLTGFKRQLPHSICPINEISPDQLSFSMPYLKGGDLTQLRALGWSDAKKMSIFLQVAQATGFAHSRHVVHRDIKPANIVIDAKGDAVLTDFDIADLAFAATQSMFAASLGSPHFAAPEQLSGETLEAEPSADIFSLGKLLYFLTTEKSPPFGTSDIQAAHWLDDIKNERVRHVISTCLRHDPKDRYQTVYGLLQELSPKTA
jgi:hypothetical protein